MNAFPHSTGKFQTLLLLAIRSMMPTTGMAQTQEVAITQTLKLQPRKPFVLH